MIYITEYYIQSIYIRFLVFSLFFHHRQIQNRLSPISAPFVACLKFSDVLIKLLID